MTRPKGKTPQNPLAVLKYPYAVLIILLILTAGATIAFHQNSSAFFDGGSQWTPVVLLIGLCVSLVIFAMTQRERIARRSLQRRTEDLLLAQQQNEHLLAAEKRSRRLAEEANRAKDQFLGIVSHELKTPLNAIAGWNRILRTPGLSVETRQTAVDKIDKNLRMQAAIVEELLNFSDIMSTGLSPARKSVDMRDVFERAVATVSVDAFQKGVVLETSNALNGEQISGDAERLKLAIVSVLANAVKFTPPGGRIKATAACGDEQVKVVVADNGQGISPDFLPYIFEQYRQCEDATTRHYGGLGLGLTIAKTIVRLHSGTIEAESAGPGCGSTFTISLPYNALH